MKKERRQWSAEEKTRQLRRHLIEKVPISKICEEERLAPSLYHRWQEQLFQNAAPGLVGPRAPKRVHAQLSWFNVNMRREGSPKREIPPSRAGIFEA